MDANESATNSGNKLSYLDGKILLKLPQLYAIQLGGSNPWRCDCRLRSLVRNLLANQNGEGALNDARTSIADANVRSSLLQDEPKCAPMQPTRVSPLADQTAGVPLDTAGELSAGPAWTNMSE